jgi:hypothetical protein
MKIDDNDDYEKEAAQRRLISRFIFYIPRGSVCVSAIYNSCCEGERILGLDSNFKQKVPQKREPVNSDYAFYS